MTDKVRPSALIVALNEQGILTGKVIASLARAFRTSQLEIDQAIDRAYESEQKEAIASQTDSDNKAGRSISKRNVEEVDTAC